MTKVFINDWYECLKDKGLGSSWLQRYPAPLSIKRRRLVSNARRYHLTSMQPTTDDLDYEDNQDDTISADLDLIEEFMDT